MTHPATGRKELCAGPTSSCAATNGGAQIGAAAIATLTNHVRYRMPTASAGAAGEPASS
jgi:hypothetical protein